MILAIAVFFCVVAWYWALKCKAQDAFIADLRRELYFSELRIKMRDKTYRTMEGTASKCEGGKAPTLDGVYD